MARAALESASVAFSIADSGPPIHCPLVVGAASVHCNVPGVAGTRRATNAALAPTRWAASSICALVPIGGAITGARFEGASGAPGAGGAAVIGTAAVAFGTAGVGSAGAGVAGPGATETTGEAITI